MGSSIKTERQWRRRLVDFSVRVLFPTRGIRDVSEARLRLRDLAEGGAALHAAGLRGIPDFFYLQFGDEKSELVGCYVVGRNPDTIHCRFSTELTTAAVERIIVEQDTLALFDALTEEAAGDAYDELATLLQAAPGE